MKASKPQKILLHMAKVGNDWKGKATCFESQTEFKFSSIDELIRQLDSCVIRKSESDLVRSEDALEKGEKTA